MLRTKFKDDTDADNNVFKVGVVERFTFPLVALVLALPELSCELSGSVFPATTDAHALVKLGTNLGERALPDVIFFELFFYSGAKCLGRHFK
jgi:hypothetical protein